jgi:hypothetical protein
MSHGFHGADVREARGRRKGGERMNEEERTVESVRVVLRETVQHRRVERLLIVRAETGADGGAARSDLEGLPGVFGVSFNSITGSFDVVFDPTVVSDDELAVALSYQGFDLISWQAVQLMHPDQQRTWLLEQIMSLASRAEFELARRGTFADGIMKGSVDAYVRTARAFGLMTDPEIAELIPARFLEEPH